MVVKLYGKLARYMGLNKGRVFSVAQLARRFNTDVNTTRKALYTLGPNANHVRYGYKTLWGYR
jgi:hypothetical protein